MDAIYQQVLEKTLVRLQAEYPGLHVVLLAGSVARGEGAVTSDLDLYCLFDAEYRARLTWIVDGVLVEIFLNPYQQVVEYFSQGDEAALHMVLTGRVVYGNPADPVLLRLREMAGQAFAAGPKAPGEREMTAHRYFALDLYEDALDVAADRWRSLWVGMRILREAVAFFYRIHGRWEVKAKHVLTDLDLWRPSLAAAIRRYMASGEPGDLKAALDEIYAPLGGIERFAYASGADDRIPIAETEIVLIRHGRPSKDRLLRPEEWSLDYTAYLELATYLEHPDFQGLERIYSGPQVVARQTAGFFFAQLDLTKLTMEAGLNDAAGVNQDDRESVSAFLTGGFPEGGEGWEEVQERIVACMRELASNARQKRQRRIAAVGHGLPFLAVWQHCTGLPPEDALTEWERILYGPYAKIRINAFGEIEWGGGIQPHEEDDGGDAGLI